MLIVGDDIKVWRFPILGSHDRRSLAQSQEWDLWGASKLILLPFHPTSDKLLSFSHWSTTEKRDFGICIVAYGFAYLWKISNLCLTLIDMLIPRIKFTGFLMGNMFLICSLILPAERQLGLAIGFSENYGIFHIWKMCQPDTNSFMCQEANWLLANISPTALTRFSQPEAVQIERDDIFQNSPVRV